MEILSKLYVHFEEMANAARSLGDSLAEAWAYRHEAYAHWNSPQKNAFQAQRSLKRALATIPRTAAPMDRASTWELHGKMRRARNVLGAAVESYTSALTIYAGQIHHEEGRDAVTRVQTTIAEINEEISSGAADNPDSDVESDLGDLRSGVVQSPSLASYEQDSQLTEKNC